MKRSLAWAVAITVLGVGTAALPLALAGGDDPPPPGAILLGGDVSEDTMVRDQPLPLPPELPPPPTLEPEGFMPAEPRQAGDLTGTRSQQPADEGRPRTVLAAVDRDELNYLGYDEDDSEHEAHEHDEEECAPGPAGPVLPGDMELTDIPGPDEMRRRPPTGPGMFEPCEEAAEDEI